MESFRLEVWTDGTHDMCAFRAEMPDASPGMPAGASNGLGYIWFVMDRRELLDIASGRSHLAVDGYHHLTVMGDLWAFYDLELDTRRKSGVLQVKFYNLELPRFYLRVLARMAQRIWARQRASGETRGDGPSTMPEGAKVHLELSPEHMARVLRLYGQGKGKVAIQTEPETLARVEVLSAEDANFAERLEYLQRIARNSTQAFFRTAKLYLSKDRREDDFYWTAVNPSGRTIMNGGLVKHNDGGWGIHT